MSWEYGAHSVVIHTVDSVTPVKLGGISAMGLPLNNEVSQDDNGQMYDSFVNIAMQAPRPQYGTRSVAAALAAIPQNGICINVDETHPGVMFYGEAKNACGDTEPASDDHLEYLFDAGLITPVSFSGDRRGCALSVEIDAITVGGNAPFAADYAATLPTGLNVDEFALAAVKIGNILWRDARTFDLQFNVERLEPEPGMGLVWNERAGRRKARPRLTVTARDPTKLSDTAIPLLGKAASHSDTTLFFKKKKNKAAFELDASTVHFKLTMHGMALFDNPFAASGSGTAETTIVVHGIHDGTNAPLIPTFGIAFDDLE